MGRRCWRTVVLKWRISRNLWPRNTMKSSIRTPKSILRKGNTIRNDLRKKWKTNARMRSCSWRTRPQRPMIKSSWCTLPLGKSNARANWKIKGLNWIVNVSWIPKLPPMPSRENTRELRSNSRLNLMTCLKTSREKKRGSLKPLKLWD